MGSRTRSLVLSGGGAPGAGWLLGMVDGLRRAGIDLGEADEIVGTSAGALAGAALASGALDRAVSVHRQSEIPPFRSPATSGQYMAAAMRAWSRGERPCTD